LTGEDATDPVVAFYDRHPYPPPVADLDVPRIADDRTVRAAHHLIWPARPLASIRSVLVAGCGTAQAVRHALRRPDARVVGIDVSPASLEHSRALAAHHGVTNLELQQLPIEEADRLGERVDHIVCTGVIHHLADPQRGLRMLRDVLAQGGALTLMVYARYGRTGIYLLQEYCRRLGIGPDDAELVDLAATLREIPMGHPLGRLLRETREFAVPDALADALCNPRDRAYSVPELLALLGAAGLRFGRWERQAPYLPDVGAMAMTPHGTRIATLPPAEQHALLELFRGTMLRHTVVAYDASDTRTGVLDFDAPAALRWVPVPVPTAVAVQERLPPGVAAALINRAHTDTDLVLLADQRSTLEVFRSIDGSRTIGALGTGADRVVETLWRHDLVVIDATVDDGSDATTPPTPLIPTVEDA
jgi:SAM-dependent methyltransferase